MASEKKGECVKVVIRCRPMSKQEVIDGRENILDIRIKDGVVAIRKPDSKDFKDFTFDGVYAPDTLQANFYNDTGFPVVESVMEGYNSTIFAYGQTGTGKTFTMVGAESVENPELRGVIPRAFEHIFNSINTTPSKKFLVRASYLEIYNEEIRDLLSKNPKQKLELKDHPDGGVFVKDLTNFIVKGVDEMRSVMDAGQRNRSVASTLMNSESSRSHSIFTVTVETAETKPDGEEHIKVGKMNMVDLAGSERQSKTGASGDTLKEATKINMSLSALGNVISALVDAKTSFIPYRDSKLTRLLQDSLGGNTKTVMCANLGPVDYNYDETLSTLRYAYRAKSIKNKPKINEDPKDAMLREFQDEIARLKAKLEKGSGGGGGVGRKRASAAPAAPGAPGAPGAQAEQEVIIEKEVQEVIVEKVRVEEQVKEVNRNITDADIAAIQESINAEKQEIEAEIEAERRQIEAQKDMADEEKARLFQELQETQARKEEEAQMQATMLQKLKAMEEKMLVGSQVMEKAMQQEQELRKVELEVEEKKRDEQRMKEALEQNAEEKMNLEDKYSSAEDQVEKMTAKLEKLWGRYKETQQETEEVKKEFQQEHEDMLETIRDLNKEVKLACLCIESFIPMEQHQQIVERAHWDETTDEWVINRIELAGNRLRTKTKGGERNDEARTLLRGADVEQEQRNAQHLMAERPSVYFAYTEDGGMQRVEARASSPSKGGKSQRLKSAGRPGTANRKGRAAKADSANPEMAMSSFLHSPEPTDDIAGNTPFPKARGLVRNA